MFQLDLREVVYAIDTEDARILEKTQVSVLSGSDRWFVDNVKRIVDEYAEALDLEARFSWKSLVFQLVDGDKTVSIDVNPSTMGYDMVKLSPKAYLFVRAFFCWFSSVLHSRMKQQRPSLLLVDTGSEFGFSFFWQLSQKERDQVEELISTLPREPELMSEVVNNLVAMSLATGEFVNFADGNIINAHKTYAIYQDGVITADHLSRKLGILCLGFYCWMVDQAKAFVTT